MPASMTKKKKKPSLGGHRDGSGRKPKENKDDYAQITVILRRETVEKLRAAGGGKFGQFLQFHLDRHPLPTLDEYRYLRELAQLQEQAAEDQQQAHRRSFVRPFTVRFKGRKIPAIATVPTPDKPRQKRRQGPVDEAFHEALAKARKQRDIPLKPRRFG